MNPSLAQILERPDIRFGDAFAATSMPTLATGFTQLDAELPGGGWPRGQLTELLPEQTGIGELGLLLPSLATLTAAVDVLADITAAISGLQCNIQNIEARTGDSQASIDVTVDIVDVAQLEKVVSSLRKVGGVFQVERVMHS